MIKKSCLPGVWWTHQSNQMQLLNRSIAHNKIMQSASCFLIAIRVPLNEKANGSLNTEEFTSSISCPGVNPISNNLLDAYYQYLG